MSQYNTLKQAIQAVIRTNGNREITGALLQQSLLSMINSLGTGYQFMGVATPSTNPGTPDQKVFYIAGEGEYQNFSLNVFHGELAIFKYDNAWEKESFYDPLNIPLTIQGYLHADTGILQETQYWRASDFVPVKPGQKFETFGRFGGTNNLYVAFYDKNKVFYGNSPRSLGLGNFETKQIIIPNGVYYARFNTQRDTNSYARNIGKEIDINENKELIIFPHSYIKNNNTYNKTYTVSNDKILSAVGTEQSQSGYKVLSYSVNAEDTFFLDFENSLSGSYSSICIYDRDGNFVNRILGGSDTIKTFGKVIKIPIDGILKISISNSDFNNGKEAKFISNEIKGGLNTVVATTIFPELDSVERINAINTTVGIFESSWATSYQTSDFYEISGKRLIYTTDDQINTPYSFFRLYDQNFNEKYRFNGGRKGAFLIIPSEDIKYIRWCERDDANKKMILWNFKDGDNGKIINLNDYAKVGQLPFAKRKVLWLGTSIPEGCHYPQKACESLGWTCYNKSLGSSGIIKHDGYLGNNRDGRDLAETTNEKIARYTPFIGQLYMTQSIFDNMVANWGFEKQLLPYIDGTIDSCDLVVFDHGYNDRNKVAFENLIQNFENLDLTIDRDDNLFDRTNYIDAFLYLIKKIWSVNPNIQIAICSFLESQTGSPQYPNDPAGQCGYLISTLNEKIAKVFNFAFFDMCNYNGFSIEFVPGTSPISGYSIVNYTGAENPNNHISLFQYFCPDGVHPHTDTTGKSLRRLTSTITKLMMGL